MFNLNENCTEKVLHRQSITKQKQEHHHSSTKEWITKAFVHHHNKENSTNTDSNSTCKTVDTTETKENTIQINKKEKGMSLAWN